MIRRISTKNLLAHSMLDLSKRQRVGKITVTEVARNCGVSRETFYYYFHDKQDLISYIFTVTADEVMDEYDDKPMNWSDSLSQFVEHIQKHYYFFRSALDDQSVNNFKQDLIRYTRSAMERSIRNRYGDEIVTKEILFQLQFYAFGAANNVTLWLLQKGEESPKEIGQMLYNSMSSKLRALFP